MKQRYTTTRGLRQLPALLATGAMLLSTAPAMAQAQMPANLDFSSGNFTNWQTWIGYSIDGSPTTGTAFGTPTPSTPIGGNAPGGLQTHNKSRHAITTGTATDYYGGFPIVCPSGNGSSARIGNDSISARADRIQYFVHVPATSPSFNIQYQYAVVLQDGQHAPESQSSFQVIAYDSATGILIPGANNMYIAKWNIPGFQPFVNPTTSQVDSMIAWLPWTASTINLSGMGGKTVVVECTALDCSWYGHWGYGYFDVTGVADSLVASALRYNAGGDSVVLQGPAGYQYYRWYNQDFSQALNAANDTARTKTLAAPITAQYYNVVFTPYAANGIPDTVRTPVLQKKSLGVGSPLLSAVRVYPNPASASLHLAFTAPFEGTVTLYNAVGESVYSKTLGNSTLFDIETSGFAAGVYTLILKDAQGASETRQVAIRQ